MSQVSILYDFVAFLALFDLLKTIYASHVSILITTLLQHLRDATYAIVRFFKNWHGYRSTCHRVCVTELLDKD